MKGQKCRKCFEIGHFGFVCPNLVRCSYCKKSGHMKAECSELTPSKAKPCYNCNSPNHWAVNCTEDQPSINAQKRLLLIFIVLGRHSVSLPPVVQSDSGYDSPMEIVAKNKAQDSFCFGTKYRIIIWCSGKSVSPFCHCHFHLCVLGGLLNICCPIDFRNPNDVGSEETRARVRNEWEIGRNR